MRSRLAIVGAVFLFGVGTSAGAQAKSARRAVVAPTAKIKVAAGAKVRRSRFPVPKLLSFKKLMSLSPKSRKGYLRQVRYAVVQLERMQNKMLDATHKTAMLDSLKELLARFTLLDSAYADAPGGVPILTLGQDGRYVLTCPASSGSMPLVIDRVLNVCVLGVPASASVPAGSIYDNYQMDRWCPPGFTYGGYRLATGNWSAEAVGRCIAQNSFNGLRREIQDGLISGDNFGLNNERGRGFAPVTVVPTYSSRDEAVAATRTLANFQPETRTAIAETAPANPAMVTAAVVAPAAIVVPPDAAKTVRDRIRRVPGREEIIPVSQNGSWSCSNAEYQFRSELGTCTIDRECTGNEGVTVVKNSTIYCVPSDSFLAMSANQQELLCPITNGNTMISPTEVRCQAANAPLITEVNDESDRKVLGGRLTAAELSQRSLERRMAPYATSRTDSVPAQVADIERRAAARLAAGTAPAAEASVSVADAAALAPAPAPIVAAEVAPTPTGGTCSWAPIGQCAASPREDRDVRRAFQQAHRDHFAAATQTLKVNCIFAGNFSTYVDNKASSNTCNRVSSVPGTDISCPGARAVLCNPAIFGVTSEGGGICIDGSSNATAECSARIQNPADFHPATNLTGEGWEAFRRNFEESFTGYCVGGRVADAFAPVFQNYFCNECNAIGRTIVAANVDYARQLNICSGDEPTATPIDAGAAPATAN